MFSWFCTSYLMQELIAHIAAVPTISALDLGKSFVNKYPKRSR